MFKTARKWFYEAITEDSGRASWSKVMAIVGTAVTAWAFVKLTNADKITPEYVLIFTGLWYGTRQVSKFMEGKKPDGGPDGPDKT